MGTKLAADFLTNNLGDACREFRLKSTDIESWKSGQTVLTKSNEIMFTLAQQV
jgi:hypothetical protein